jgi:very-short-patch-repair endonuclease
MEPRTRPVLVLGGLPKPALQVRVRRPGAGAGADRLDLAYEELKVGIEYDGEQHRDRAAFAADLRWHNRLLAAGWTVLRVTASDVLRHPDRLAAEVGSAVERRRRELGTAVVGHGGHRPGVEFDAWAR